MQTALIESMEKRAYEGATKGRRGKGWHAPATSATTEITRDLQTLRNRSRDLVRNNAHAARAAMLIPSNVVGLGVQANITSDIGERHERQLEQLFKNWAHTTAIDFDETFDLFGLQTLVMRTVFESGECLVRRRRNKSQGVAISLQVLEPDFLANEIHAISHNGNRIVNGIEFNKNGKRVAYHLYEAHPGSAGLDRPIADTYRTVRVSADDVLHVFRKDRPGQINGVPWLAPVMLRLKDLDGYFDAQLIRQKIAACFSVFVRDVEIPDLTTESDRALVEKIEPGIIEFLPPGKSIETASPPQIADNYAAYAVVHLREIAAGLGVSFEALTGDLERVNFSSARLGWLEFQRSLDQWRCQILNNQFGNGIFEWFLDAVALNGVETEASVTWVSPRREMIDPGKEIRSKIAAVRGGIETLSDVVRANGKQPDAHFEQLAKDAQILDKLGLKLDTDPRYFSQQGILQDD